MEFIYYIINFLILAAIIFFAGRKAIVKIFRTRREKIEAELNSAEAEIVPEKTELTPLPPKEESSALIEARALAKSKIDKVKEYAELECRNQSLAKVQHERDMILKSFREKVSDSYRSGNYAEKEKLHNKKALDEIISRIKLTPGDLTYLKHHNILYITISYASSLDEELIEKAKNATEQLLSTVNGKSSFWIKQDESLIGGLRLRIGDTVYDASVEEQIYLLTKAVQKIILTDDDTVDSVLDTIDQKIKSWEPTVSEYQLGRVISVSDGICWMDGLSDIMYGEVVEFDCGERGMVLDIQKDKIGCAIFGRFENIETYTKVRRVGRIASMPAGDGLLGRIVDAIGNPLDSKGFVQHSERRPIEFAAPGILDRESVSRPMHTGIKAIDSMVPIGKGQRELLVGDRQTGKTAIVLDTIINQRGKDVVCIYVGIGQKETTISDLRDKLEAHGAMDYTVIVSSTASESAAMQYIAPFAATAIGESFMYSGRDVLIVYDDLSKHAVAYRELSLLLQRPSGREAYPGDIFYLHSRLLERSAQLSKELGGGSMTALPIIETQAGDISSYIPTNVISITDGQIFLEGELFHAGQRPAVNVGLSVSRVGGSAQTKLMKQIASSLRTKLAQYRELAEFTQFGADIDEETRKTLNSGEHLTEALKQNRFEPLEDWKQALLLYAVSEGLADNIDVKKIAQFEKTLYDAFDVRFTELRDVLKTGNKMTSETADKVKEAVLCLVKEF